MKQPSKYSPQETKNLELEWYEYLLPRSERDSDLGFLNRGDEQRKPALPKGKTSKNNSGYFFLFGVIFLLLCYIASFFTKGLW